MYTSKLTLNANSNELMRVRCLTSGQYNAINITRD